LSLVSSGDRMKHVCLQVYVEKGEFELAKRYCMDNPAQIDQVLVKQAEMYFNSEQYVMRHSYLSLCETVLLFPNTLGVS
jgi:hypothetical protein